MAEPAPIPVSFDPIAFALTNVSVDFDEEQFVLRLTSGNHARGYVATPKHAKRIMMLLSKQVSEYEKKHGEIATILPKTPRNTEKRVGF